MSLTFTRAQRGLVWVMTTALGPTLGIVTDPLVRESSSGDILSALVLSPLLVTMMGGVGAPLPWMPVLWPLGCCFWPLFFWLSYAWVQNAARWAWVGAGVLTSIAYFGLMTKFFAAMSA